MRKADGLSTIICNGNAAGFIYCSHTQSGSLCLGAVKFCLRAGDEAENILVEVIVIDSESDDGSWEMLSERFSQDNRVHLVQNQRGLGPTRSWLDGARLAKGAFVTFVWSDDYISPRFINALLPILHEGSELAIGTGIVRDVDDESDLPVSHGQFDIEREDFLFSYFTHGQKVTGLPVSPACALFKRKCFDKWAQTIDLGVTRHLCATK